MGLDIYCSLIAILFFIFFMYIALTDEVSPPHVCHVTSTLFLVTAEREPCNQVEVSIFNQYWLLKGILGLDVFVPKLGHFLHVFESVPLPIPVGDKAEMTTYFLFRSSGQFASICNCFPQISPWPHLGPHIATFYKKTSCSLSNELTVRNFSLWIRIVIVNFFNPSCPSPTSRGRH
jgi:hypothetical protein